MKYVDFQPCIFIKYWIFHIGYVGFDHNNMYNMVETVNPVFDIYGQYVFYWYIL